jgi:hypothetical protein
MDPGAAQKRDMTSGERERRGLDSVFRISGAGSRKDGAEQGSVRRGSGDFTASFDDGVRPRDPIGSDATTGGEKNR